MKNLIDPDSSSSSSSKRALLRHALVELSEKQMQDVVGSGCMYPEDWGRHSGYPDNQD